MIKKKTKKRKNESGRLVSGGTSGQSEKRGFRGEASDRYDDRDQREKARGFDSGNPEVDDESYDEDISSIEKDFDDYLPGERADSDLREESDTRNSDLRRGQFSRDNEY